MALATYRHNETGELLELSEDWLDRFPKDPYTRVSTDELAKLEIERRNADAAAVGAQEFQQPETIVDSPTGVPADAPTGGDSTDGQDTPAPPTITRDERRF